MNTHADHPAQGKAVQEKSAQERTVQRPVQDQNASQVQMERMVLSLLDRILFVIFGAALALGAMLPFMALMDLPRHPGIPDFAWLAVWTLLQVSLIGALVYLLGLGRWDRRTRSARNRLVARFFILAWLGACEFVAWVAAYGVDTGYLARSLLAVAFLGLGLMAWHRRLTGGALPVRLPKWLPPALSRR